MAGTAAVILAAGQGKRMRSSLPKVLHQVAGRPMIHYVVEAVGEAGADPVVVVLGHGAEQVQAQLPAGVQTVVQPTPLGTADATRWAASVLCERKGLTEVLVCYGDCPLLTADLFRDLARARRAAGAVIALAVASSDDPTGYGRVIVDAAGRVRAVVEEAVASDAERAVRRINAGVYCYDAFWLWEALRLVQPSPTGEYYLTDLVGIAVGQEHVVQAVEASLALTSGVNDRVQLAAAERILRDRVREKLMRSGVTLIDPATTYVDSQVTVGADTVVYPGTLLEGRTTIGSGCRIGPHTRIVDSTIGDDVVVTMSVVEEASVANGVRLGPFSHLRPGARIGEGAELGNYAEVKNATIGAGTRMHHFSYVGDAEIGVGVNVGAGTITCNFDSESGTKSRTVVEDGASLGSDTMLVAPIRVGREAMTGAGSVVTRDVEPGTVVVGVPARPLRPRRSKT